MSITIYYYVYTLHIHNTQTQKICLTFMPCNGTVYTRSIHNISLEGAIMNILAIANQKGGVGKTTTSCTLAYIAANDGKRVLLIDADAQCNSTDTSRVNSDGVSTLYDLLINKDSTDCIQHTNFGYDIIAGDPLLRDADKLLSGFADVFVLKEQLENERFASYDLIIIDTPPALGTLLMASLTAASHVLVPMTADRYAAQGINRLARSVADTKKYTNPNLTCCGVLLTRKARPTKLSQKIETGLPELAEQLGTTVLEVAIRETVRVREAQAAREPLMEWDNTCTAAQDYQMLYVELKSKGVL